MPADSSYGYQGTIDANAWAKVAPNLGTDFGVRAGLSPSIASGVALTTRLTAGVASAFGITDEWLTSTDLTHPAASGSATRWDTIVIRRNRATKISTLLRIGGASARAVAASAKLAPTDVTAGEFDHLVCLARVNGAVLAEHVDLRSWTSPTAFMLGTELPPAALYRYGQELLLNQNGGQRYRRAGVTGAETWVEVGVSAETGWVTSNTFATGSGTYQFTNGTCHTRVRGTIKEDIANTPSGSIADRLLTRIPSEALPTLSWRTTAGVFLPGGWRDGAESGPSNGATFLITANGDLFLASIQGGTGLSRGSVYEVHGSWPQS